MSRKYIIIILLLILSIGWIQAQSEDDDFDKLRSALDTQDQKTEGNQQLSKTVQSNRMPQDPVNIVKRFIANLKENKSLVNLISIISALIVIIILLIVQFSLRKQMKNIQEVHEKKYRLRTSNLIKSVEQQNKELVRLRKIEGTYSILKNSNDSLKRKTAKSVLMQQAIKFINHGVVLTDLNGRIIYTNRAFERMHDYTAEELVGQNMDLLIPEMIGQIPTLENSESWLNNTAESSSKKKDGSFLKTLTGSSFILDDDEKPQAVVTSMEDITRSSETESILKESEENFRRIFENIQDIYYEVDIDGYIYEISSSINTISNISREELIGKRMDVLYADEDQRLKFIDVLKKESNLNDYEINLKGKHENKIPCTITAKVVMDDHGLPSRIVGSIRNIKERKAAQLNLMQTLKELQVANKDLTDFAYITSHDLKSPLRAINTLANWVMMDNADSLNDEGKEQMNLLIGRTERMHHLIEAIFEYTNVINIEAEKVDIDMNQLMQKVVKKLEVPKNIDIDIPKDLPHVVFENTRMEQIFENLIENSIRFMDKEKGHVSVDIDEIDGNWEFSVNDNGPGIEEKYHDKVFEIFQTLNTRDTVESAGIGLAIVKKIITKYDGEIKIYSNPGAGMTISFKIPKLKADEVFVEDEVEEETQDQERVFEV
jgi:two-component system, LuxR family, sensor kinase FixL